MNFGTTDLVLILVLMFIYLNGRTLESTKELLLSSIGARTSLDDRTLYERMERLEDILGEISYTLSQLFGTDLFDEEGEEQRATIFDDIAERLGTVSRTLERIEDGLKKNP